MFKKINYVSFAASAATGAKIVSAIWPSLPPCEAAWQDAAHMDSWLLTAADARCWAPGYDHMSEYNDATRREHPLGLAVEPATGKGRRVVYHAATDVWEVFFGVGGSDIAAKELLWRISKAALLAKSFALVVREAPEDGENDLGYDVLANLALVAE